MTAAILAETRPTHLGGNIGRSLLGELADGAVGPDHVVVLELSSFQLTYTPLANFSPAVALVTNLQANHLDRHGTMAAYAEAKKNIFRFQRAADLLLLPAGDDVLAGWADEAPGRVAFFDGDDDKNTPFDLAVPGAHNQRNAQAAWAVARATGAPREAAARALKAFCGLPHRLALVGEYGGVRYFDDSKATTPAGAVVALNSFDAGSVVAIVGGYDKKIPLDDLCAALAARCKAVIATGQVGGAIAAGVRRLGGPSVVVADAFDDACDRACRAADAGDVVLLSPACASYDQFDNYIQRGLRFQQRVAAAKR